MQILPILLLTLKTVIPLRHSQAKWIVVIGIIIQILLEANETLYYKIGKIKIPKQRNSFNYYHKNYERKRVP